MSSFTKLTKHPKTGKFQPAHWLDNYFGRHNYGVRFEGESVIDARDCDRWVTQDEPKYEPPLSSNHFVQYEQNQI